jgi:hypothetical protein
MTATRCAICNCPVTSQQSAHAQCGGHLPDNPREYVLYAARHIENQLKARPGRLKTREQLCVKMRPEYRGDVFAAALAMLLDAGKIVRDGERVALAPARRPPCRPQLDDGAAPGLFPLPVRVTKDPP